MKSLVSLAAVISVVTAAKQPRGGTWVNFFFFSLFYFKRYSTIHLKKKLQYNTMWTLLISYSYIEYNIDTTYSTAATDEF